jgi:uncharacterized protein (DUF362 family)
MSTAALTLGIPLAVPLVAPLAGLIALWRRLSGAMRGPRGAATGGQEGAKALGAREDATALGREGTTPYNLVLYTRVRLATVCLLIVLGILGVAGTWNYIARVEQHRGRGRGSVPALAVSSSLVLSAPAEYRAKIFHVNECPEDPAGDRFVGLDNLLALMGHKGVKFYESATQSLTAGPGGIIASDDVVLIKINYQWPERGGTNVDLLRGLIRRILDHPDTFTGEVVVCENAQFNSTSNFDRSLNNAQDHALSPHDVVAAFQQAGYNVSHYDWTTLRYTSTTEYSEGSMLDGYVVFPYNAEVTGRVSYPKFRTLAGTYISLKHGIWDPGSSTYSREHLKFINVPVLKSHHAVYGATACVKHYMGVVTRELGTNSHAAIWYGILGALVGEIGPADLNILDCIWINANPYSGPETSYAGATRRNELVASLDPVAADVWAVQHILENAFLVNGYMPPWPLPDADADNPNSHFRKYLDNSMQQILAAGYAVTNDQSKMDAFNGSGRAGDFDFDGDVDLADYAVVALCFAGSGGGPSVGYCYPGDLDADGDVDCADWAHFLFVWTGPGDPPSMPGCASVGVEDPRPAAPGVTFLSHAVPNPAAGIITIRYSVAAPGRATLRVVDASGRVIKTLFEGSREAGEYSATWDRKNESGGVVAGGVYFYQLEAGGTHQVRKVVVVH